MTRTSHGPAGVRGWTDHDPNYPYCVPGNDESFVKVGYRGAENNSPVFLWITSRL